MLPNKNRVMAFADVASLPHVDHVRRIERHEHFLELVAATRRAMHEDMHMRVPPRHITMPNPERDEGPAKLAAHPCAEVSDEAIEISRARRWWRQRSWIGQRTSHA